MIGAAAFEPAATRDRRKARCVPRRPRSSTAFAPACNEYGPIRTTRPRRPTPNREAHTAAGRRHRSRRGRQRGNKRHREREPRTSIHSPAGDGQPAVGPRVCLASTEMSSLRSRNLFSAALTVYPYVPASQRNWRSRTAAVDVRSAIVRRQARVSRAVHSPHRARMPRPGAVMISATGGRPRRRSGDSGQAYLTVA